METLTAYQANELTPEEDGRIQDHLLICRHCTDLLLDLEEFLRPPEPESIAEFQTATSSQKARRDLPGPVPRGSVRPAVTSEYQAVKPRQTYRALAALLGLIVVGQFLYEVHLHRKIGRIQAFPEQSVDLIAKRNLSIDEPEEVVHPPVSLSFQVGEEEYNHYRIDFLRDKRRVRSSELLLPRPATGFNITLTDQLPPGLYEVEVYGRRDGEAYGPVASGKIRIQP